MNINWAASSYSGATLLHYPVMPYAIYCLLYPWCQHTGHLCLVILTHQVIILVGSICNVSICGGRDETNVKHGAH